MLTSGTGEKDSEGRGTPAARLQVRRCGDLGCVLPLGHKLEVRDPDIFDEPVRYIGASHVIAPCSTNPCDPHPYSDCDGICVECYCEPEHQVHQLHFYAPDLYDFIATLENDDRAIPAWLWGKRNALLAKARGERPANDADQTPASPAPEGTK